MRWERRRRNRTTWRKPNGEPCERMSEDGIWTQSISLQGASLTFTRVTKAMVSWPSVLLHSLQHSSDLSCMAKSGWRQHILPPRDATETVREKTKISMADVTSDVCCQSGANRSSPACLTMSQQHVKDDDTMWKTASRVPQFHTTAGAPSCFLE